MVAQKFKILSKRTVRGSALNNLSDTKQGFNMPRRKQKCMENGQCNICKFCTCLLYLCLLLNYFFQLDMIFLKHSFWETELTKQMTDEEHNVNLGKIVFDDNTIKREILGPVWDKPAPDRWLCFYLNFLSFCWSSLVALGDFTFQKLVTNLWVGFLCSAVGYILPSSRLWTS